MNETADERIALGQKQVSFRMDAKTFLEFRKLCLDRGLTIKDQLTKLVERELDDAKR